MDAYICQPSVHEQRGHFCGGITNYGWDMRKARLAVSVTAWSQPRSTATDIIIIDILLSFTQNGQAKAAGLLC